MNWWAGAKNIILVLLLERKRDKERMDWENEGEYTNYNVCDVKVEVRNNLQRRNFTFTFLIYFGKLLR